MSAVTYIFDSNATVAFATFITATVAYLIYRRQRDDAKRGAANTVVVEIQGAERKLRAAKESFARGNGLLENSYLMKTESWSKNKYLFIKDLNRDDWDAIAEFYDNCLLYDEMLRKYSEVFSKNEQQVRISANSLLDKASSKLIAEIVADPSEQASAIVEYNKTANAVNDVYLKSAVHKTLYTPQKTVDDAKFFLDILPTDISQKSPGEVLKRLAGVESNNR